MQTQRISSVAICAFLAAGLLGFVAFQLLYDEAFPEASIDLRIDADGAAEKSREFLAGRGFDLAGYRHAVSFRTNQNTVDFLERHLGLAEANRILRETVAAYRWHVRWFKELNETEFAVSWTPDGRLAHFARHLPDKEPGARLPRDEGRAIAEAFLRETAGLDPDTLEFIEHNEDDRPERTDRTFTWRLPGFDVGGSEFRYYVTVQGDRPGRYGSYVRIPESWTRERDELAAKRDILSTADGILVAVIGVGSILTLIWLATRRKVRWKAAAVIAVLGGAVFLLTFLNKLPQALEYYETTESYPTFWTNEAFFGVMRAVFSAFGLLATFAAADAIGRRYLPDRAHCSGVFTRAFLRSTELHRQTALGYGMALAALGYVTAFYVVGQRLLGVWVPVDVPVSDTLSTYFPAVQAIHIGFSAAMNEELLFRLFSIAVLVRLTRRPWLAVLIPAIVWGFAHTSYPQEPIWIRGAELTIAGVVYGWVFLRYGLLTTLTSHYVYNCFVGVVVQLQSGDPVLIAGAVAALGVPLIFIGALPVLRRIGGAVVRRFAPTEPVAAPTSPAASLAETGEPVESPVARPVRASVVAAFCVIAAAVYLAARLVPVPDFYGDPPAVQMTQDQAREACLSHLRGAGVDPEGFTDFTVYRDNWADFTVYAFDQLGLRRVHDEFGDRFGYRPVWFTRWFREKTIQTYKIGVYDSGKLRSIEINLADDDPGVTRDAVPRVEEEEAKRIAREFLAAQGVDTESRWEAIEVRKTDRPNRWDWNLTYRDSTFELAGPEQRATVEVAGDRVTYFGPAWYRTPPEWSRAREIGRSTLRNTLRNRIGFGAILVLVLSLFIWFFVLLSRGMARKIDLAWAAGGALLFELVLPLVHETNRLPGFYYGYYENTEQTLRSFLFGELAHAVPGFLSRVFGAFVMLLIILVFLRALRPGLGGPRGLLAPLHPRRWRNIAAIQGVILGVAAAVLSHNGHGLIGGLKTLASPASFPPQAARVASINLYQFCESLRLAHLVGSPFFDVMALLLIAVIARRLLKKDAWIVLAMLAPVALLEGGETATSNDMLLVCAAKAVEYVVVFYCVTRVLRWNPMAYCVFFWCDTYWKAGTGRFLSSPAPFWIVDVQRIAWLVLPIAAVLSVGLWQRFRRRRDGIAV